jgi:hypothetical protein
MSVQHSPQQSPQINQTPNVVKKIMSKQRTSNRPNKRQELDTDQGEIYTDEIIGKLDDVEFSIHKEHQELAEKSQLQFDAIFNVSHKLDDILSQNKLLHDTVQELMQNQAKLKADIEQLKSTFTTNKDDEPMDTTSNEDLISEITNLQQKFQQRHTQLKQTLNSNLHNQEVSAQCHQQEFTAMKKFRHLLEGWYPHAQTITKHIIHSPDGNIWKSDNNPYITTTFHQTIIPIERFNDITKQLHTNTYRTTLLLTREDFNNTLTKIDTIEHELNNNKDVTNLASAKAWKAVARGHGDLSDRTIYRKTNITNSNRDINNTGNNNSGNNPNTNRPNRRNNNNDEQEFENYNNRNNYTRHNNYNDEEEYNSHNNNRNTHNRYNDHHESAPVRQHTTFKRNRPQRNQPPEANFPHYENRRMYNSTPHTYYRSRQYDENFPELTEEDRDCNYRHHKYDLRRQQQQQQQQQYYRRNHYNTDTDDDDYYLN